MFHDLHGLGLSIILKSQSHQIALSTSESSPNCMESILVLDASQNFKICISFPSLDIKSFDLIFLASSGLHLKKDFFIKYFDLEKTGTEIFSNTDAILEDYDYKKENYIRDYFYVTDSKREFYSRAEKHLREKNILKDGELLNVSYFLKKGNKKSPK